jgi:hypothetical protein
VRELVAQVEGEVEGLCAMRLGERDFAVGIPKASITSGGGRLLPSALFD